jgi:Rrf2 family protein
MQFSNSVEHALHSLFYMMDLPKNKTIGIKKIAEIHNLTDTYLSKIFSKLRKASIVRSTPGINGGYELSRDPEDISFWDVVEAIEGSSYFFQCADIREKNIFEKDPSVFTKNCPCLIKTVMYEAEELFRDNLKSKSLLWLHQKVKKNFSPDTKKAIDAWAENI